MQVPLDSWKCFIKICFTTTPCPDILPSKFYSFKTLLVFFKYLLRVEFSTGKRVFWNKSKSIEEVNEGIRMSNKDTKRQRGNVYHLTRKHFGRSLVFSVTQRLKKKKKRLECLSPCYFCCLYWMSFWRICSVPFWVPGPSGRGVWEMRQDEMSWQRIVLPSVSQKCLLLLLRSRRTVSSLVES